MEYWGYQELTSIGLDICLIVLNQTFSLVGFLGKIVAANSPELSEVLWSTKDLMLSQLPEDIDVDAYSNQIKRISKLLLVPWLLWYVSQCVRIALTLVWMAHYDDDARTKTKTCTVVDRRNKNKEHFPLNTEFHNAVPNRTSFDQGKGLVWCGLEELVH